ncbi:MAG TPA: cytochrome c [Chthoniobacterales bacterium]|nr:cytochrome c [Chthoniobacterales bacterium]
MREKKFAVAGTPSPARETRALPRAVATLAALLVFSLASCRRGMVDSQHVKPLAENTFFADGRGARVPPPHTVARGQLRADEQFYTGKIGDQLAATFPMPVTHALLTRGQERFNIYCAVCHGPTGAGNGMIVQRGFPQPPSFHEERLRDAPPGHFVDVITTGYGVMYSYASRVAPEDRWAIAAYIRALQLSQHAAPNDADPAGAKQLEAARP